ncbi:peptide deformylase [Streptomyces sp. CB01881]|uniref:peptide deformylase n=1 Tax=Streptomyces sp. CB01881 TaxID=2078691 RepID=UPI000CDC180A|nr:peptide deformylase [Streptomyces sp. CB01881]AUY49001.1 peptide deformylase [Streptomyces sp. CB01881]TYC77491.1 peptide deformylase [Streptomyces sp. CB01881]
MTERTSTKTVRGSVRVQGEWVAAYPEVPPEALRGEVRRITVVGEEVLHRRCRAVAEDEFGTSELSRLVDDMFATMWVAEGAGLAANQIGVDLQVFVWDCLDEDGVRHVGHILNPVLDDLPSDARRLAEVEEGCLSVPGPYLELARPDFAVVRGHDLEGRPLVVEGRGYFARCLQHETDHLYGGLYIDRLSHRGRRTALRRMEDRKEKVFAKRAARAEELARLRPSAWASPGD